MDAAAVERLCAAVEQAMPTLAASPLTQGDLGRQIAATRAALTSHTDDARSALPSVRAIRYTLMEACDGPIAAILADSAARLIGDDTGKIFL